MRSWCGSTSMDGVLPKSIGFVRSWKRRWSTFAVNSRIRTSFWIEPDTGRVLMTELRAGDMNVRGTIDVSYQSEPLMRLLAPIEMREEYFDRSGAQITGVATYGRFRLLEDE